MVLFNEQILELLALRASLKSLGEKLEASQAREAQLREALATCRVEFDGTRFKKSVFNDHAVRKALALPTDDSALKARLKAERERCAKAFSQWDRDGRWAAGVIRNLGDE